MEDKSFEQAMQDLKDQYTRQVQEAVRQRLPRLLVDRITTYEATLDIDDLDMREAVRMGLNVAELLSLLGMLQTSDILSEEQHEELQQFVYECADARLEAWKQSHR